MTEARPFHVLVEIYRSRFHPRLREIETWLSEWQMDTEIGSVLGDSGQFRIRFADERAAYAFQRRHGGRVVSAYEIDAAKLADAADEDLYDRLAREYPDLGEACAMLDSSDWDRACQTARNVAPRLECAPAGRHDQAAVLTEGRAC